MWLFCVIDSANRFDFLSARFLAIEKRLMLNVFFRVFKGVMMRMIKERMSVFILIMLVLMTPLLSAACTGIRLIAEDQSVVYARTLEFSQNIESKLVAIPKGYAYTGATPSGRKGLQWKSRFAMVGMNAFDYPLLIDGINEKGLAAGLFYFPGYAQYQPVRVKDARHELAPWELGTYLLSRFSRVDQVKEGLKKIKVVPVIFKPFGIVLPVHYIVTDASGKSLVIEYQKGQLYMYDNPIGVITNAPSFPWMMTNLGNYMNLSVFNVPPLKMVGHKIEGLGQGGGLLGLPGDFTPPSRFVRATVFSQAALPVSTGNEAVLTIFHLLNQFDLPKGSIRSKVDGKTQFDYTQWTSAADLKNKRYYFRTYDNQAIHMIDLTKIKFKQKRMMWMPINLKQRIEDITDQLSSGPIE